MSTRYIEMANRVLSITMHGRSAGPRLTLAVESGPPLEEEEAREIIDAITAELERAGATNVRWWAGEG